MPYIIMKRNDIPSGVLQITDLSPNTSLRNAVIEPPGQTGYKRTPPTTTPVLVNNSGVITFASDATGLAAWFLTNVNDGTGATAVGTATVAAVAALDTFTITTVPAFLVTAVNAARTPGGSDFSDSAFAGSDIAAATSLVAAINDDVNWSFTGTTRPVVATNGGGTLAVVTVTALTAGTAGNYVLASSNGVRLAVVGMAGGVDADSLTAAEAVQDATDVLGLVAYGVNGTPAGAVTLAAINGALTTGQITAGQLPTVLQILAGAEYLVAAGTQIEAASAFGVSGTYGLTDGTLRTIYDGVFLRMSFTEGVLSKFVASDYTYKGVEGAALVVYDDTGALYTI